MLNSKIARLAMEDPVPQYQIEKATAASAVMYGTETPTKEFNSGAMTRAQSVARSATPKRAGGSAENHVDSFPGMAIPSLSRSRDGRVGSLTTADSNKRTGRQYELATKSDHVPTGQVLP
jgi:hypothetical protein